MRREMIRLNLRRGNHYIWVREETMPFFLTKYVKNVIISLKELNIFLLSVRLLVRIMDAIYRVSSHNIANDR